MIYKSHNYYIYIMASFHRTIYIGVTNDLVRRVEQHKDGVLEGFSKKYKTHFLVYYEHFTDIRSAISREKELKAWRREKKVNLIEKINPAWLDLYKDIIG